MNREAGNGLPKKVGIGWRERDRKEIEEGVFNGGVLFFRGKTLIFFIRTRAKREAVGFWLGKKQRK